MPATDYQLLPPLSSEEYDALKASIARDGIRDPVIEDEAGNVLDGNQRLKIDPNAPRRRITGLTEAEKKAFVFQANFTRRNLSPSQKEECNAKRAEVARALRDEGKKQK